MLHPDVIVRKSPLAGRGLFATKFIPKGTILWLFKDIRIYTKKQFNKFSGRYKSLLDKYAYEDADRKIVYCTDNAKYWNHSCEPNSTSLDQFSDIAIKDIKRGEELTYDYSSLLKEKETLNCNCNAKNCRGIIKREPQKSKIIVNLSDFAIKASKKLDKVRQPLLKH